MSVRLLVFRVALAMLLQTGISRGDAIDGDWCSTDGYCGCCRGWRRETRGQEEGRERSLAGAQSAIDVQPAVFESGPGIIPGPLLRTRSTTQL